VTELGKMQNLLEVNHASSQLHIPHYFRACGMKKLSEKVYNNWCEHAGFTFAACIFIFGKYCLVLKMSPGTLSLPLSAVEGF
jgi:hypothetical protein